MNGSLIGASVGIALLAILLAAWIVGVIRRKEQGLKTQPPQLQQLRIHPYPCCVCSKELENGAIVVTLGTSMGHAECVVLLKHESLGITTVGGSVVSTERRALPWLVLRKGEWSRWLAGEVADGDLNIVSMSSDPSMSELQPIQTLSKVGSTE